MAGTEEGETKADAPVSGTDYAAESRFSLSRVLPAFAAEGSKLETLRKAVDDAASVSGGLWLSYLFVLFYLLIAAGAVTHKDLLFESPVKLPFLGVELPLLGFFALGPMLFLIAHAYILLHFVMMAGKITAFNQALRDQIPDFEARQKLRRQLPSNIFVQFLAGPRDIRHGPVGALLWGVATISLVAGPVCLLLFFQMQFLPYHNEAITWWQRIAVALDLWLVWKFWPSIIIRDTEITTTWAPDWPCRLSPEVSKMLLAIACRLIAIGVPVVTSFPGEWLNDVIPRYSETLRQETFGDDGRPVWTLTMGVFLRTVLVEGEVDPIKRRPASFWSNRLVLPGLDVIDHAKFESEPKIEALPETISLSPSGDGVPPFARWRPTAWTLRHHSPIFTRESPPFPYPQWILACGTGSRSPGGGCEERSVPLFLSLPLRIHFQRPFHPVWRHQRASGGDGIAWPRLLADDSRRTSEGQSRGAIFAWGGPGPLAQGLVVLIPLTSAVVTVRTIAAGNPLELWGARNDVCLPRGLSGRSEAA